MNISNQSKFQDDRITDIGANEESDLHISTRSALDRSKTNRVRRVEFDIFSRTCLCNLDQVDAA